MGGEIEAQAGKAARIDPDALALIRLLEEVPELEALYWKHQEQFAGVTSYPFMAEVAEFTSELYRATLDAQASAAQAGAVLNRICRFMSTGLSSEDENLVALIGCGFLEELERDEAIYAALRTRLAPAHQEFLESK